MCGRRFARGVIGLVLICRAGWRVEDVLMG